MTNTPPCTFAGDRDEALVEYLYAEPGGPSSHAFAAHLDACAVCRAELEAFGGVRRALSGWAPPEPIRALEPMLPRVGPRLAPPPPAGSRWDGWRAMPVWAQAAAALLCVGVALGAANVRVQVGGNGVTVATGWLTADERPTAPVEAADAADAAAAEPWRSELTALEERLRGEIRQQPASTTAGADASSADDEALIRRIRALIAQSEQRQQRELALRIGDVMTDMQSQRRADLSRIDRTIGLIQNNTGMEVLRQREMLNSLAVRVSGQR